MRIVSSLRWRALAVARALGHRGNPRLFGVEVPLDLISSAAVLQQMDARSYEAKEARLIQAHLPKGASVLELGASLGFVSSVILLRAPVRLVSYEAVGALLDLARKLVAHNHGHPPWEPVHGAIAPEGVHEVAFKWSPGRTQAGTVTREAGPATLRVPAFSLGEVIARHALPASAWLVMDVEGMEWELARNQAAALRRFAGIIVECHDVHEEGRLIPYAAVIAELMGIGFALVERRGRVVVLHRR
ncbi:MAG: FkbM family methyltransferase [Opitutia bacterium]